MESVIKLNNPHIIVLTEVAPKNNRYPLQKSEIELDDYQLFVNDLNKKGHRGVAIYVKKCILADEINWRSIANDTLWVEIMLESKKKMVIEGVYRSPNNSIENNQKIWITIKKTTEKYKENILIVGDFNCKEIEWKTSTTNIANVNNVNNLLLDTIREC